MEKQTSYSRPRPKSKGDIQPKLVRTTMNQVSGELEHVILDAVQVAYEHAIGIFGGVSAYDHKAKSLDPAEMRRFREKCVWYLLGLLVRDPCFNQDEIGRLRELCLALGERCHAQSELLAQATQRAATTEIAPTLEEDDGPRP